MIFPDKSEDASDEDLFRHGTGTGDDDDEEMPTNALPSRTTARDGRFGKVVGGRYRIQDRLGKGGMASVYRAVDRLNGSEFAVKILDPRYARDPTMARRCQREARAMAELANHHIPCAFVVGTTDEGETYIVMEFLRGRDLEHLISSEPPMPWRRAFALALQICDALQAAHARNIIHRDVKPSNCFLIQEGEDGGDLLKLIDFGIAKDLAASGDPTGTGMVLGTPGYIAPELVTGDAAPSALTDVYALGVTLYKLLTHRLPWEGRSHVDVVVSQRHDPPHPIREGMATAGRRMPRAAEIVVMTAFASAPQERYTSARAFAAALRAVLRAYPAGADADEDEVAIEVDGGPTVAPEAAPAGPVGAGEPTWAQPSTRPPAEVGARSLWRSSLVLGVAVLGFIGVLLAVPAAPARPLAPGPVPFVAAAATAREQVVSVDPPRSEAEGDPTPDLLEPPGSAGPSVTGQAATRPRPFRPAAIRKEVEGERAYLLKTCAPRAPGRRVLDFTLVITPSGRLDAVEGASRGFAGCVRALWRHTRFAASDDGGRFQYRLVVPEGPSGPPLRKLKQ